MKMMNADMNMNDNQNFDELNKLGKKQGLLCYVTIQIGEKKFPCHRVVLISSSSYFKAMFDGNYEESKLKLITMKEMDPLAFEEVLQSMYTGRIIITQRNACRLLKACSFLGLREFEKSCISFAEKNQLVDNILEMCLYANLLKEEKLFDEMTRCIAENFMDLAKTYDFSSLPLSVFQSILSQENLDRRDDVVLVEIVKWLKRNSINEPFTNAEKFLKAAKLTTVSCSMLGKLLSFPENLPKFMDDVNEENKNSISEGTLLVTGLGQPTLKTYLKASTLKASNSRDCFISLVCTPENKTNWVLADIWESPFSNVRTVILGERQYFLSYKQTASMKDCCQFWMVKYGKSKTLCNPPVVAPNYELVALKEIIFLYFTHLGAKIVNSSISHTTLEDINFLYYNPELDKWFVSPKMKEPVKGAAFVGSDNCLYLFGGGKGPNFTALYHEIQRWDVRQENWEIISGTRREINGTFIFYCGAACTFENNIYLSGSTFSTGISSICYTYEPRNNKLCNLSKMNVGRSYHTLTPFKNELYALSNSMRVPVSCIEKYQFVDHPTSWVEESPFPKKIVSGNNVFWTKDVTATIVSNYCCAYT